MNIAIVSYPSLDDGDRQWIETFRARHDPQAGRVATHFTFVFPIDMNPGMVEGELPAVARSTSPISISIRRSKLVQNAVGGGIGVFLVPDDGREEIEALHDRLYAGVLRPYLRTDIPYIPHLTIGVAQNLADAERLMDELAMGSRVIRGTLTGMDLVDLQAARIQTVVSYRFSAPHVDR